MKLSQAAEILNATLVGKDADYNLIGIDSRVIKTGELFIALDGPNFDAHQFIDAAAKRGASGVVVSRRVESDLPLIHVDDTRAALALLAADHRERVGSATGMEVIAVTGSCGKTSTRAMLESIFSQVGRTLASEKSFNNEIGVSLTLLRLTPDVDYAVIEIGANHHGEIAQLTRLAQPNVALITNAAAAHLEGFGDLDGVACAKGEIYQGLDESGVAVINNDDHYANFWRDLVAAHRLVTFGIEHPADVMASSICFNAQAQPSFQLLLGDEVIDIALPLMGQHNVMNALAAAAAAYALGVSKAAIKAGLENVLPVDRRLIENKGFAGATIIDDSYNANPSSVCAAIDVLAKRPGDSVLVFGDMLELGEDAEQLHCRIGAQAQQSGISRLYCYGQLSRHTAKAFGDHGYHFDNQELLLQALRDYLHEDVTVLIKGSNGMKMCNITAALLGE